MLDGCVYFANTRIQHRQVDRCQINLFSTSQSDLVASPLLQSVAVSLGLEIRVLARTVRGQRQ